MKAIKTADGSYRLQRKASDAAPSLKSLTTKELLMDMDELWQAGFNALSLLHQLVALGAIDPDAASHEYVAKIANELSTKLDFMRDQHGIGNEQAIGMVAE